MSIAYVEDATEDFVMLSKLTGGDLFRLLNGAVLIKSRYCTSKGIACYKLSGGEPIFINDHTPCLPIELCDDQTIRYRRVCQ